MDMNDALRNQIEGDIKLCESYSEIEGSEQLYKELIARYEVIDSNFGKNLLSNGKSALIGQEFDYRSELQAIASKLKMFVLLNKDTSEVAETNSLQQNVKEFVQRGEVIGQKELQHGAPGFPYTYVSGPMFDRWMNDIKIFAERNLHNHPLYDNILTAYTKHNQRPSAYKNMMSYLDSLVSDDAFWSEVSQTMTLKEDKNMKEKIFIVHGHDETALLAVDSTLRRLDFEPIILREQASGGSAILGKIESYSDVKYAVVLYTECDIGRDKNAKPEDEKFRARQNVVFEHGYLIGKLGREKVCALVKGEVEKPGDIDGVVYIPMDDSGAWKIALVKELRAAGLSADANKL